MAGGISSKDIGGKPAERTGGQVRGCGCFGNSYCWKCKSIGYDVPAVPAHMYFGPGIFPLEHDEAIEINLKPCTANPSCGEPDLECPQCRKPNCPSAAKCWGCGRNA